MNQPPDIPTFLLRVHDVVDPGARCATCQQLRDLCRCDAPPSIAPAFVPDPRIKKKEARRAASVTAEMAVLSELRAFDVLTTRSVCQAHRDAPAPAVRRFLNQLVSRRQLVRDKSTYYRP